MKRTDYSDEVWRETKFGEDGPKTWSTDSVKCLSEIIASRDLGVARPKVIFLAVDEL